MPKPIPEDEIVDPARIKAMLPKKPEEIGPGSIGAWLEWLRHQRPVRAKFVGPADNSGSDQKK